MLSVNGREFLDQLSDYQLLKKGCAPWSYLVGYLLAYYFVFIVRGQNIVSDSCR
jgi:hypothetical protein